MMKLEWQWAEFGRLDGASWYEVLRARQDVFVLEQQCLYPDIDGADSRAYHLLGWGEVDGQRQLLAYLRCFAPGEKYAEASLGRVLTVRSARGAGLGKLLLAEGIRRAELLFPHCAIRISAQERLQAYYGSFGFLPVSEIYMEDGIPHIEMLR